MIYNLLSKHLTNTDDVEISASSRAGLLEEEFQKAPRKVGLLWYLYSMIYVYYIRNPLRRGDSVGSHIFQKASQFMYLEVLVTTKNKHIEEI